MSLTSNFTMSNPSLTKTIDLCERDPGQWKAYSDSEHPQAHNSTHGTLCIRSVVQTSGAPVFDVAFMEQDTMKAGKFCENPSVMTSKDFQDATGLNHAAHYKMKTGEDAAPGNDAIFVGVSPHEVNALAAVNCSIARERAAAYATRQFAASTSFELGLDDDQNTSKTQYHIK